MLQEKDFYIEILAGYIEKYVWITIIVSAIFVGIAIFYAVKKNKVYTILTVVIVIVFQVFFGIVIKDAKEDYEKQTIIIEKGTIQHNVSESFLFEDITFYPDGSNESVSIFNNFLVDVDCPHGEYEAVVVYGEYSGILLFVLKL